MNVNLCLVVIWFEMGELVVFIIGLEVEFILVYFLDYLVLYLKCGKYGFYYLLILFFLLFYCWF